MGQAVVQGSRFKIRTRVFGTVMAHKRLPCPSSCRSDVGPSAGAGSPGLSLLEVGSASSLSVSQCILSQVTLNIGRLPLLLQLRARLLEVLGGFTGTLCQWRQHMPLVYKRGLWAHSTCHKRAASNFDVCRRGRRVWLNFQLNPSLRALPVLLHTQLLVTSPT